jgi:hypothetical protein
MVLKIKTGLKAGQCSPDSREFYIEGIRDHMNFGRWGQMQQTMKDAKMIGCSDITIGEIVG